VGAAGVEPATSRL